MKDLLFSTPLWTEKQFISDKNIHLMKEKITQLNCDANKDKPRTVVNGWRIDNPHRLDEFQEFGSTLIHHCKELLEKEIKQPINSITLTSWLNIIKDNVRFYQKY